MCFNTIFDLLSNSDNQCKEFQSNNINDKSKFVILSSRESADEMVKKETVVQNSFTNLDKTQSEKSLSCMSSFEGFLKLEQEYNLTSKNKIDSYPSSSIKSSQTNDLLKQKIQSKNNISNLMIDSLCPINENEHTTLTERKIECAIFNTQIQSDNNLHEVSEKVCINDKFNIEDNHSFLQKKNTQSKITFRISANYNTDNQSGVNLKISQNGEVLKETSQPNQYDLDKGQIKFQMNEKEMFESVKSNVFLNESEAPKQIHISNLSSFIDLTNSIFVEKEINNHNK